MSEPSKYSENQFLTATRDSFILMSEIIADAKPKLTLAASENATFNPILVELTSSSAAWDAGETILTNREAALRSATLALEDKLESLTRKPDADTNSVIETWDTTIRAAVAYQGTTYTLLLPNGRETLTAGSIEAQIDAIRDFGVRLSQQTTKPTLVALAVPVTAFATALRTLRTTQNGTKAAIIDARGDLEALRILNCQILYSMTGTGMSVFRATPERVDELFSVSLLRGNTQQPPEAPTDTTSDSATRTISTTAMPPHATRLEVYRQAPGGAPELLVIGEPGQTTITIPAMYVFTAGVTYQVWLQGRNSRGTSAPGPMQEWLFE
ncbi:MAG: hypothetical protein RL088_3918 [Verrucomicrobiota bacterium]|jgi:hypothetical protein